VRAWWDWGDSWQVEGCKEEERECLSISKKKSYDVTDYFLMIRLGNKHPFSFFLAHNLCILWIFTHT
jgi:hypothetical protein